VRRVCIFTGVRWMQRAVADGFVDPVHHAAVKVHADIEAMLDALAPAG
jgi:hypothetical protein